MYINQSKKIKLFELKFSLNISQSEIDKALLPYYLRYPISGSSDEISDLFLHEVITITHKNRHISIIGIGAIDRCSVFVETSHGK